MNRLCLLFIFAVLSNEALGMSYRHKRQSENENEGDLEDRYGWNRPNFNQGQWGLNPRPWRPNPFPGLLPDPTPFPPQNPRPTRPTQDPVQEQTPLPQTNQEAIRACLRNCPTTSEYNPVCGTNSVTYDNPGRLICAQSCGVTVSLLRSSRCPATTPAPS